MWAILKEEHASNALIARACVCLQRKLFQIVHEDSALAVPPDLAFQDDAADRVELIRLTGRNSVVYQALIAHMEQLGLLDEPDTDTPHASSLIAESTAAASQAQPQHVKVYLTAVIKTAGSLRSACCWDLGPCCIELLSKGGGRLSASADGSKHS